MSYWLLKIRFAFRFSYLGKFFLSLSNLYDFTKITAEKIIIANPSAYINLINVYSSERINANTLKRNAAKKEPKHSSRNAAHVMGTYDNHRYPNHLFCPFSLAISLTARSKSLSSCFISRSRYILNSLSAFAIACLCEILPAFCNSSRRNATI